MCGIAGCFNHNLSDKEIADCINSLSNRGPNNNNFFREKNVCLIHTRLSILDLSSRGSQPMSDENNNVHIIYNGEIYNFLKLKKKYNFDKSIRNDTEIILRLYIRFGINFITKLKGMFAFSIWDSKKKKLFLVRDRFGIKPLYKYKLYDKIFFGSEPKSIFKMGIDRKINFSTVKDYILNGVLEDNQSTFFKNIEVVKPGTYEEYSNEGNKVINYWNIDINKQKQFSNLDNYEEIKSFVKLKINNSVKEHLISDVNLGVALSSGLDSQILLNSLQENNIRSIKTFTYGFEEKDYDESNLNSFKNFDIKIDQKISVIKSNQLISSLNDAIEYFDNPLGGLGTLSLYNLMKLAKEEKTPVILTGEGADEVFVGYKYYYYYYLKELYKQNNFDLIKSETDKWSSITNEKINLENLLDKISFYTSEDVKAPDGTILSDTGIEGEALKNINIQKEQFKYNSYDLFGDLRKKILKDLFSQKIPKLLMFQDRSSMSSSIEARVPFLDHELVESIFSLNSRYLVKDGKLKNLLREIYSNKLITDTNKSKKYVATPQREWIKQNNFDEIYDIINMGVLKKNNIINFDKFSSKYIEYKNSKNLGNSFFVWKILNLELLLKNDL